MAPAAETLAMQRLATDGRRRLATPINLPASLCNRFGLLAPVGWSYGHERHADWPRSTAAFLVAVCDLEVFLVVTQ